MEWCGKMTKMQQSAIFVKNNSIWSEEDIIVENVVELFVLHAPKNLQVRKTLKLK